MIDLVYAHPYPSRSRANAALLRGLDGLEGLDIRSLYELYPDFDIDVEAERRAVDAARLVVWMHPIYWYTAPSLMKHWFDQVLVRGWAFGEGGTALQGKDCLWVATAGGDEHAYSEAGRHRHSMDAYQPVIEQTARYCGMNWVEPFIVEGAHIVPDAQLEQAARALRVRIEGLVAKGNHA